VWTLKSISINVIVSLTPTECFVFVSFLQFLCDEIWLNPQ
jgi:hypothetical protein